MFRFRAVVLLVFLVALTGCTLPWKDTSGDLSRDVRVLEQDLLSARAEVAATTRLIQAERENLNKTLDVAASDILEAKALLSLEVPPLDRVQGFTGSANTRIKSVKTYLEGV